MTFTLYSSSKYILHTNEGKHYLISANKKAEIEKILESNDEKLKKEFREKIENLKSNIKNKHLFLSDFQFRKALISEENMQNIVKPFEFFYNKYIFLIFVSIIAIVLPFVYFHLFFFEPQSTVNISYSGLIFFVAFIFHEIGHSTACTKYKARAGEIGFAVLSYLPVLYSDVTDAWRLKKQERMIVNFGGVYFQNLFSIILLIISLLTHNIELYIIAKAIFILTVYQFIPFYKSDGYWILSDIISEPNLFDKARRIFRKKLNNPLSNLGARNNLIMSYYIIVSAIVVSFIIKMGFYYYVYIFDLPFYIFNLLKNIIQLNLDRIKIDQQHLFAFIYMFFIIRMIISNIKEFILSKGADKIIHL